MLCCDALEYAKILPLKLIVYLFLLFFVVWCQNQSNVSCFTSKARSLLSHTLFASVFVVPEPAMFSMILRSSDTLVHAPLLKPWYLFEHRWSAAHGRFSPALVTITSQMSIPLVSEAAELKFILRNARSFTGI